MARANSFVLFTSGVLASAAAACGNDGVVPAIGHSATLLEAVAASATTYRVGPNQEYAALQDVVGRLQPGDVVELMGGANYPGGVVLTAPGTEERKITIRGVKVNGARPVISGGNNVIEVNADHYVIEGLEIANATTRGIFHHAGDITIRDSVVHDCPNGILGANEGSGSLWLEHTEIYRCGQAEKRHAVYMETDESAYPGSVFRMQFCYVHDSLGGNNIKSRAERNEIYYNWIQGGLYHDMELVGPDGQDEGIAREDSDVVGNVIVQEYQDQTHPMIRVGGDGTGQTWGRYRFVNNTILVGRRTTSPVFRLFDGIESFEAHNNVIYKQGGGPVPRVLADGDASWRVQRRVAGSNNWVADGSGEVPSEWLSSVTGTDPGFQNLATLDLRPALMSPLRDAGNSAPAGPSGCAMPSPLGLPQFEPPLHAFVPVGADVPRPATGELDIGAYEEGTPATGELDIGASEEGTPATGELDIGASEERTPATAAGTGTASAVGTAGDIREAAGGSTTGSAPDSRAICADEDAFVRDGSYAQTSFGGDAAIRVKTTSDAGYRRDGYLKFDLLGVGAVKSAVLQFAATLSDEGSVHTAVYPALSSDWSGATLTWSNRPGRSAAPLGTVTVQGTVSAKYRVDVSRYVQSVLSSGGSKVAVVLHNPEESGPRVDVTSREADGVGPELVLSL